MTLAGYIASFIGHEPGKARFVGLYKIGQTKPLTHEQYWKIPAYVELKKIGMRGFLTEGRASCLWFDLTLTDFYSAWKERDQKRRIAEGTRKKLFPGIGVGKWAGKRADRWRKKWLNWKLQ